MKWTSLLLTPFAVAFSLFALGVGSFPSVATAKTISSACAAQQEVFFNLMDSNYQEQVIVFPDGKIGTIGVEKVEDSIESEITPAWNSYYHNATGKWRIFYSNPTLFREYYINISSSHKITKAWGGYYQSLLCAVSSEKLTYNSSKASYRLNWVSLAGAASGVAMLDAMMEGTTLHTYAN